MQSFFQETVACHLISVHNIQHQLSLMREVREAIKNNSVEQFLKEFLAEQFVNEEIPQWVRDAVHYMGYKL